MALSTASLSGQGPARSSTVWAKASAEAKAKGPRYGRRKGRNSRASFMADPERTRRSQHAPGQPTSGPETAAKQCCQPDGERQHGEGSACGPATVLVG